MSREVERTWISIGDTPYYRIRQGRVNVSGEPIYMGSRRTNLNPRHAVKHAVIVGASGGIGQAVAKAFAGESWRVTSLSRSKANHRGRDSATHIAIDLKSVDSIRAAADEIRAQDELIDCLVNCAGVMQPDVPSHELSVTDWKAVIDVNLTGPFVLLTELFGRLTKPGATIINLTGGMGRFSLGMQGGRFIGYRTAKAGLNAVTLALAQEWGPLGIRVIALDPGWVRTPMGGSDAPRDPGEIAREVFTIADDGLGDNGCLLSNLRPVMW